MTKKQMYRIATVRLMDVHQGDVIRFLDGGEDWFLIEQPAHYTAGGVLMDGHGRCRSVSRWTLVDLQVPDGFTEARRP